MNFIILVILVSLAPAYGFSQRDFPLSPDRSMTPGSLCNLPTQYRYPERIAYCDRIVDGELKAQIFTNYRKKGFQLAEPRDHYKIDHFIPLCAGGSNEMKNLWPQHMTIFTVTDEMEGIGCKKLQEGKIRQADLVRVIKEAKYDNSKTSAVIKYLYSL
jgi:hypothetical protein